MKRGLDFGTVPNMPSSLSLTEQSLRLLKLYEEDDEGPRQLKPHQQAASMAHQASAHADAMSDKHRYGKIGDEDAFEIRDAHKHAHDLHVSAAQALTGAGHHSLAQDHISVARQHASAAAKYHEIHKKAYSADPGAPSAADRLNKIKQGAAQASKKNVMKGAALRAKAPLSPKLSVAAAAAKAKGDRVAGHERGIRAMQGMGKKAVGESREIVEPGDQFVTEQRRLMGFNGYSSLAESVTLQKLDQFESDIQSWRYRQRDLMGLESHYPRLSEVYEPPSEEDDFGKAGGSSAGGMTKDPSQGLADVNYQVLADKAERASVKASKEGGVGNHEMAAQAHMAASKLAMSPKSRVEHEALAAHHSYHASRSGETKVAQVRQRVDGGPVIGVPTETIKGRARIGDITNRTSVGESMTEARDTRDIPKSVKDQAKAIEKDGGPMKKRRGGAKSRAGIAYAIAWKHHCKTNPGSRHCSKSEDAVSDKVLAKLDKKKSNSDAALDTLAKLRKKNGMEHREGVEIMSPAVRARKAAEKMKAGAFAAKRNTRMIATGEDKESDKVLAKLGKKHGTHDAALDTLAKLRKKHGMEQREDQDDGSQAAPYSPHPPLAGSAGEGYDTEDEGLMAAVDEAWQAAFGDKAAE